jgi:succinoglycan biosynthesis protein ExoA
VVIEGGACAESPGWQGWVAVLVDRLENIVGAHELHLIREPEPVVEVFFARRRLRFGLSVWLCVGGYRRFAGRLPRAAAVAERSSAVQGRTIASVMDVPAPTNASVSVVIPVRNEAKHITATLTAFLRQAYPLERLEIVVVDGCSEDATRALVEAFAEGHPELRVRLVDNPERVIPWALNRGIQAASGEIIVRMDGHSVPADDYVEACVRALARSGAGVVGGCITPRGDTPFGRAVATAQASALGAGDAAFHYATRGRDVDTVYLGAYHRSVPERVGLYDTSLLRNEDYEWAVRVRQHGYRVHLDPAIRSTYVPRATPRALAIQYAAYGWWKVETLRRHPRSLRWRQFIPALFVATLVSTAILAPIAPWARQLLGATLLAYALAHVLAGVTMGRSGRYAADGGVSAVAAARVHLAIATLHLAWGAGFLANLLSFGRWPVRAGAPNVPRLGAEAASGT